LIEGLNPGPLVEIEFWKTKCSNLENIVDQVNLIKIEIFKIKTFTNIILVKRSKNKKNGIIIRKNKEQLLSSI
jgi:hypothetical protein